MLVIFGVLAQLCISVILGRKLIGRVLLDRFGSEASQKFISPFAYFFGTATYLTFWQLCNLLTLPNAITLPLIATTAAILLFWRTDLDYGKAAKGTLRTLAGIAVFVSFYVVLAAVPITEFEFSTLASDFNAWAGHTNVVHGFRAASIALQAAEGGVFPVISQNVAQSALAVLPMYLSGSGPLIIIAIQFGVSIYFLFRLIFSLLIGRGLTRKRAFLGSSLALTFTGIPSIFYVGSTDTGNSLLLLRNHDAVLGFGLFVCLYVIQFGLNEINQSRSMPKKSPFTSYLLIVISISGFQIISNTYSLVTIGMFFSFWLLKVFKRYRNQSINNTALNSYLATKRQLVSLVISSTTLLLSTLLQGFGKFSQSNIQIPTERGIGQPSLSLSEAHAYIWGAGLWYPYTPSDSMRNFQLSRLDSPSIGLLPIPGEHHGIDAIITIFLAYSLVLASLLVYTVIGNREIKLSRSLNLHPLVMFLAMTLVLLIPLTLFTDFYLGAEKYSLELTRLFQPIIFISGIALIEMALLSRSTKDNRLVKGVGALLLLLSTLGTVFEASYQFAFNVIAIEQKPRFGCFDAQSRPSSEVSSIFVRIDYLNNLRDYGESGSCPKN